MANARNTLERVRATVVSCTRCPVRAEARQPVPCSVPPYAGDDPSLPRILVVGRNPGKTEDRLGVPFVGRSGELLTEWLKAAGLDRERDVVITNLLKCHTEKDRKPLRSEYNVCAPLYLTAEVKLIEPRLIIGFGADVSGYLTGLPLSVTSGNASSDFLGVPVFMAIHPAATLHGPSNTNRFWNEAEALRRYLEVSYAADV